MKKAFCILLSALLLSLYGCTSNFVNVDEIAKEQSVELVNLLSENDTDGIREMFCTAVSDSDRFNNDLLEAVEFFEGEVLSYDIKAIGSDEKSERGKLVIAHISPKIWDIKTNAEKRYRLSFYAYIINSDHPEYAGISEILIESDDGKSFKLGDYSLANP